MRRMRTGLTGGRARKKLLSPSEIESAIVEIDLLAKKEGTSVALAGGCAMFVYGSTRLTTDVDFLAADLISSLPRGKSLTFGGVATITPSGVPVDLIVRNDDYESLYDAALGAARVATFQGVRVRVVTAEYLLVLKLAAARPKDGEDFKFLVTEAGVNVARAKKIAREHLGVYATHDLEREVEMAKFLHARENREK